MVDFMNFFDEIRQRYRFKLEIYYSNIMDWCIDITLGANKIIHIQDCDKELAFAKAQVKLKEYLIKEYDGY